MGGGQEIETYKEEEEEMVRVSEEAPE